MEGDKVIIISTATDVNGAPVFSAEIGEKPKFMLEEEYHQQIIGCAIEAVKMACKAIYPNNDGTQAILAEAIANRAING